MQGWRSTAAAAVAWYRAQPRAVARALRPAGRRRVLQPADRAAPSDRVLRGPPAGVQLQHAGEEGARRRRASTRGSRRCSRAASIRTRAQARSRRAATRRRWPARDAVRAVRRRGRSPGDRRARQRAISIGRAIRCSIAPKRCSRILEHEAMHQETLLYMWHRLPFEQKRAPAGYRAARRRRAAARRVDRRFPPAARRSASTAARCRSAGTTSVRRCASTCRRSRSSATT